MIYLFLWVKKKRIFVGIEHLIKRIQVNIDSFHIKEEKKNRSIVHIISIPADHMLVDRNGEKLSKELSYNYG